MNAPSRKLQVFVWALLALILFSIVALFLRTQMGRAPLPEFGTVQPFALTNELNQRVTLDHLKGQVWVADVIFTRCGGPCPKMTETMSRLQNEFPANEPLKFVTLTTDPAYDTPEILKRYGQRFGADFQRWNFLTGPKSEILKNLATGSLKLAALDKDPSERERDNDLFIHATIFVLVDKQGKVRGYYESLEPGFREKIQADIRSLLTER
jgi:protein SCO1/2